MSLQAYEHMGQFVTVGDEVSLSERMNLSKKNELIEWAHRRKMSSSKKNEMTVKIC